MGFYFPKGFLGWALITGVLLLQGGLLFFKAIFEITKFRENVENNAKMQNCKCRLAFIQFMQFNT